MPNKFLNNKIKGLAGFSAIALLMAISLRAEAAKLLAVPALSVVSGDEDPADMQVDSSVVVKAVALELPSLDLQVDVPSSVQLADALPVVSASVAVTDGVELTPSPAVSQIKLSDLDHVVLHHDVDQSAAADADADADVNTNADTDADASSSPSPSPEAALEATSGALTSTKAAVAIAAAVAASEVLGSDTAETTEYFLYGDDEGENKYEVGIERKGDDDPTLTVEGNLNFSDGIEAVMSSYDDDGSIELDFDLASGGTPFEINWTIDSELYEQVWVFSLQNWGEPDEGPLAVLVISQDGYLNAGDLLWAAEGSVDDIDQAYLESNFPSEG